MGYLDYNKIPDTPFTIIIGARQVGKTYGGLKWLLGKDKPFLYMRRTLEELELAGNESTSIFTPINDSTISIHGAKATKYTYEFKDSITDKLVAVGISLSTIAKLRGFSGANFDHVLYDEFIPESHIRKITNEGDAFLNAYATINGNRELEGKDPLKVLLLANAFNLNHPVLQALGVVNKLKQMRDRGQNLSVLPDRGITIINVFDSPIAKIRAGTALYKASNSDKFNSMSLGNDFSYNDTRMIRHRNIKGYKAVSSIGDYTLFINKSGDDVYIAHVRQDTRGSYIFNDSGIKVFRVVNSFVINYYLKNRLYFDSFETLVTFKDVFQFLV